MVKTFNVKKCHKTSKRRRISKKIKFIRQSNKIKNINKPETPKSQSTIENSIKSEHEVNIDYSLLNWSFIFLQQISCPQRYNKEFIHDFINIINNLCINKNEFISWTLYIEHFLNKSCREICWDIETLKYIGIYTKKVFDKITVNYGMTIDNEKMSEIISILDEKKIDLIELNQRYNYYNNFAQKKKNTFYDFNEIVEYIYKSNNYKNVKKEKKEKVKVNVKEVKNINKEKKKDSKYSINNGIDFDAELISVKREDDINQDNNSIAFHIDDLFKYDNENLPDGEAFMKLDSSYENLNMNVDELYYINNK